MTSTTRRDSPLSRDRVLRAAAAFADGNGLASLSMRKLGETLGVEAMSLYHHVANKAELLDGMVDLVFAEIDLPADGADWKTAMRVRAVSARRVLARHRRNAVDLRAELISDVQVQIGVDALGGERVQHPAQARYRHRI